MREIEGELFLLSARSVELGFEDGHQFERLYGEGKDSDLDLPILKEDKRNAHAAVRPNPLADLAEGVRRLNGTD